VICVPILILIGLACATGIAGADPLSTLQRSCAELDVVFGGSAAVSSGVLAGATVELVWARRPWMATVEPGGGEPLGGGLVLRAVGLDAFAMPTVYETAASQLVATPWLAPWMATGFEVRL
jgi:hypothetical protein